MEYRGTVLLSDRNEAIRGIGILAQKNNRRRTGEQYEQLAAEYLIKNGLKIIEHNFRTRNGEIDLIARDGDYLVFIEVKYRKGSGSGSGADAVNARKQRIICRISDYYRTRFAYRESTPVRFDVVECAGAGQGEIRVRWYRDAFPYVR